MSLNVILHERGLSVNDFRVHRKGTGCGRSRRGHALEVIRVGRYPALTPGPSPDRFARRGEKHNVHWKLRNKPLLIADALLEILTSICAALRGEMGCGRAVFDRHRAQTKRPRTRVRGLHFRLDAQCQTISLTTKVISPAGASTLTLSPTFLPSSALPSGLSLEILPSFGLASAEPTR